MADFALNEDQLQIQKWVHDFAEDVIRPAGHEWDEREEFPYPIVAAGRRDRPVRLGVPAEHASATRPA